MIDFDCPRCEHQFEACEFDSGSCPVCCLGYDMDSMGDVWTDDEYPFVLWHDKTKKIDESMKSAVLKELIARWDNEAIEPETMDGSPEAEVGNYIAQGERQAKRECADTLRMLMTVLPDFPDRSDSPASMN